MTVVNKKWSETDVLADALGERSLRDAADWLNEKLPADYQRTHATLNNWLYGVYPIPFPWIEALVRYYPKGDERRALGLKLVEKHGVSPVYLTGTLTVRPSTARVRSAQGDEKKAVKA